MLHVACTVYCNQYVSMAPQRWHEALHHYQSSSPSWYLSVEKTVRCIVSRLCGWNHQPQAKDSAWKPKPSTSSTTSSPATSTSLLLTWIVAKVQKFYVKLVAAAQEFSSMQCPCSCMLAWLTRISSLVCTIWLQHHISSVSQLFLLSLFDPREHFLWVVLMVPMYLLFTGTYLTSVPWLYIIFPLTNNCLC